MLRSAVTMPRRLSTLRGPPTTFRLVTVNPKPERAAHVASLVTARLRDRFTIQHVGNIESEDAVASTVAALQPDILVCSPSPFSVTTCSRGRC